MESHFFDIPAFGLLVVRAHGEEEGAAGEDLVAGDAVGEGLAVEGDGGDVEVGAVQSVCDDGEPLAVGEVPDGTGNLRGAEDVLAADGVDGVEAAGGEQVPGGHLTAVFIAAQAVRGRGVEAVEHFPDDFRRPVGTVGQGVEVRDVVAGFVAVGVLSDESGDVRDAAGQTLVGGEDKEGVRFLPHLPG